MKPQLRTVRKVAGDAGQIEPVSLDRALALWSTAEHARKYLAAIRYLRESSKSGWVLDKKARRKHELQAG